VVRRKERERERVTSFLTSGEERETQLRFSQKILCTSPAAFRSHPVEPQIRVRRSDDLSDLEHMVRSSSQNFGRHSQTVKEVPRDESSSR